VFTGIIQTTAPIAALTTTPEGARLTLHQVPFAESLELGESLAVNGCCLTVTATDPAPGRQSVHFDLLAETLRVTNLSQHSPGQLVNLERALRVGDRLSGHFVQGHIDTTAAIIDYSTKGQEHRLEIALPEAFQSNVIPRGSIAVDGISLTIADLTPNSFVCWIIPHTHGATNLRARRPAELVNLEFDLIGKYVARGRLTS